MAFNLSLLQIDLEFCQVSNTCWQYSIVAKLPIINLCNEKWRGQNVLKVCLLQSFHRGSHLKALIFHHFYCYEKLLIFRKDLNLTEESPFMTLIIP